MTNLDFTEVRPDSHTTTAQERATAFLTKDLCRQYPDRKDVHLSYLAADLAQELTMIAARYNLDDYAVQLRRPVTTSSKLEKLSDL